MTPGDGHTGRVTGDNLSREGRSLIERVIDYIDYEVSIVDKDFRIVFANKKRRRKHGREILGKRCFEVFPEDARTRKSPCPQCPCKPILEQHRLTAECFSHRIRDRKNRAYYIKEKASRIVDDSGNVVFAINVVDDISEDVFYENARRKLDGVKTRLQDLNSYDKTVELIVKGIQNAGYRRVRFYEANLDRLLEHRFFVGRNACGMAPFRFKGYRIPEEESLKLFNLPQGKPRMHSGIKESASPRSLPWLKDLGLEDQIWIDLPLVAGGNPIGLIAVDNKDGERRLSRRDVTLLSDFSKFAAQAVANSRSVWAHRLLGDVTREVEEAPNRRAALDVIAKQICLGLEAAQCALFVSDKESGKLRREAIYIDGLPRADYRRIPVEAYSHNESLTERVSRQSEVLNILDLKDYERRNPGQINWDVLARFETVMRKAGKGVKHKNAILAPLRAGGERIGSLRVINNLRSGTIPFPDSDRALLAEVSTQVALALKRMQLLDDLKAAKKFAEDIINSTPDSVMVTKRESRVKKPPRWTVVYANEGAHTVFGCPSGSLRRRDARKMYTPESVEKIVEALKAAQTARDLWVEVQGGAGAEPVAVSLSLSKAKLGREEFTIGFCKSMQTVVELKKKHKELEDLHNTIILRLGLINATMSAMGFVHDSRTALMTVSGFLDTVVTWIPSATKKKRANADLLLTLTAHLKLLRDYFVRLDKFLNLTKTEFREHKLRPLFQGMFEILDPKLKQQKIKYGFRFHDDDYEVAWDGNQIQQVVLNLLQNSIHAHEHSSGKRWIRVSSKEVGGGWLEIVFADNGIGIPLERRTWIWEAFHTTKDRGVGLGLVVCRKIIQENHGGAMYHQMAPDGSTEFVMRLRSRPSLEQIEEKQHARKTTPVGGRS